MLTHIRYALRSLSKGTRRSLRLTAAAAVVAAIHAAAQQPVFEVATVKGVAVADQSGTMRLNSCTGGPGTTAPGVVTCRGLAFATLVQIAYRALPSNISGPAWIESERYDILAKPPAGATAAQIPEMLRSLLEDRFGLEVRRESKQGKVYDLRAPKGAAKLSPSQSPDQPEDPDAARARGRVAAERRRAWGPGVSATLIFEPRMSMSDLAGTLSKLLDHPVRDSTGISGIFEVELMFAQNVPASVVGEASRPPTVFEALEEIGLKLEAATGANEKIVVVSAHKEPREN